MNENLSRLRQNFFGNVVETSFYSSRGTMWKRIRNLKKVKRFFLGCEWKNSTVVANNFRQGFECCIQPVPGTIWGRKMFFFQTIIFKNSDSGESFLDFHRFFLGKVVTSALYVSKWTLSAGNFSWKIYEVLFFSDSGRNDSVSLSKLLLVQRILFGEHMF